MAAALKLTRIGNSVGVVLPKEILARLKLEAGDSLHVAETPRGYEISAYDAEFATQMEIARDVMRRNRDVLRELAK